MSKKSMTEFQRKMFEIRQQAKNNKENNDVFKCMLVFGAFALRTKFGFGAERIERWMDEVNSWIDTCNDGDTSIFDIEQVLEEETGIKIQDRHRVKPVKDMKR